MRYIYALLLVNALWMTCHAQDISTQTIRWASGQSFNTSQGEVIDEATTLTSYADRLEWRNANGTVRKIYHVSALVQEWSNVGVPGRAVYKISDEDNGGVAIFERTSTGIRIMLTIARDEPESFEILVSNYQVL
jgi:hypothetical protein